MLSGFKHLQFQVLDIKDYIYQHGAEDLALKIAMQANEGDFDLIVIKVPEPIDMGDTGKQSQYVGTMIYKILKLTGCPVMSISKWPVSRIFRNILQPVDLTINLIERYELILPAIKVFNAKIHLLLVNNTLNQEVSESCRELLEISREYFLKFDIRVKSKIINHLNTPDTILAYANIIGADLIGNGTGHSDNGGSDSGDMTWNDLIYRSDIPLFNYYG